MQIDFHHAVTYILARWAGFSHEEADIIAYSAQYVDDSTYTGCVEFDDGQLYSRIASAHKTIDARNLLQLEDARTWVPFHFLPGNANPKEDIKKRMRCTQNSVIAQNMLHECLTSKRQRPINALHRLGITLHVYADTWAHKGFAGIDDTINDISDVTYNKPIGFSWTRGRIMSASWAYLGHAQADICPDLPFLEWEYKNSDEDMVHRNNTDDFIDASDNILKFMRTYSHDIEQPDGLSNAQREYIRHMFSSIQSTDEKERHREWLRAIKAGEVPEIAGITVEYSKDGEKSWKYAALGTTEETGAEGEPIPFPATFMNSNWRRFHDALQHHRLFVLTDLLPRYGICAA